jgi:hypothetical protein
MSADQPYPLNAPGPFYVADGDERGRDRESPRLMRGPVGSSNWFRETR